MPQSLLAFRRHRPNHLVLGAAWVALAAMMAFAPNAAGQRTKLKPGWNLFSPDQDVQIGHQNAQQAEKQLPMCGAPKVDAYLTELGRKLVAKLPTNGIQYPFEFHCVNDKAINAFALPGGYVFVNRGTIEAADNEAQLAAVMGHELSHVALRHGTNQATKAQFGQGAIGILGGVLGNTGMGQIITQLGAFGAGSILMRYSRTAETQADVMGTQVLYDSGYDPRAMAQFFEKLQQESKGKNPPEFFSDHPSPEHRVERVDEEIDKLGGAPPNAKRDSLEFQAAKREVLALPVVAKAKPGAAATGGKPAPPSANFTAYSSGRFAFKYPENWKKYGEGDAVTFAPDGGVVQVQNDQAGLAYGMSINMADVHQDSNESHSLEEYTDRLLDQLRQSNPGMKTLRKAERVRLNGQPGLSTYLSNASPMGGQETDWVVTVLRPEGLLYFIGVAPQAEYETYDKAFASILDSVRFK